MARFKEINRIANNLRNELLINYCQKVHSQILPLEKLRIHLLLGIVAFYTILFAKIFYFIVHNVSISFSLNAIHFVMILIFCRFMVYPIITIPIKILSRYYKGKLKKFYPEILKNIGFEYFPNADRHGICASLKDSKLFAFANESEEEDIFSGTYKGVGLTISESRIIDSGYSNGNTKEKNIPIILFKGIIVNLTSNKQIKSTTLIKPKKDLSILKKLPSNFIILFWSLFGLAILISGAMYMIESKKFSDDFLLLFCGFGFFTVFGWWFIDSFILRELRHKMNIQKVNLEDVNLSKHYQAYSYDQIEARYLITPAFIERFMYLEKVFHTKNIRCSFVHQNLIIAIGSNKNNFELGGLCTSLTNPKHINNFLEQIVAILLIVDCLKLDEKTSL